MQMFDTEDLASCVKLAKRFSELVQESVAANRGNIRLVIDLNKADADSCCHTHDFCDANMDMLQAFNDVYKREPDFMLEWPQDDTRDMLIWNHTWDITKQADFFI